MNKPKHPRSMKLKRPGIPVRLKRRKPTGEDKVREAFNTIPRITNETVAEHREQVIGSARKYKYPLQHSKRRIVAVSTGLVVSAAVIFFVYSGLALYKFQSTNSFIYRVSQVLPFPVAKAGGKYVAYENYLFEVRRYIHYYTSQQRVNFGSESGKQQLATYKPKALADVVQTAYVKQLAAQNGVRVSGTEVNIELNALRAQNQLGSSNQELSDVANQFFGWTIDDLKRQISQELLAQKVAAKLDTSAKSQADSIAAQAQASGADFSALAVRYSADQATATNGGKYADTDITTASVRVPPAVVAQLKTMQAGQVSGVIYAGSTYEIVKLLSSDGGKIQAAHISVKIADINTFITPYEKAHPVHTNITVK